MKHLKFYIQIFNIDTFNFLNETTNKKKLKIFQFACSSEPIK